MECVEYKESLSGLGRRFWDVSGVKNHIVDSISGVRLLFGDCGVGSEVDQESQAP